MEDDGIKTYEITGGADQLVQPEITKEIVIRSDAPFDKFDKAMINGLVIDPKYYTVTKGSTVITLNADFIEKIPAGTHVFGIISTDGVALTSFTVEEKPTEDKDNQKYKRLSHKHGAMIRFQLMLFPAPINVPKTVAL